MTIHSLILKTRLVNGGKLHLKVVNNGSGKSESKTELIAVEEDSKELRSASVDKSVDKSTNQLKTDNGTKSNANNHLEVTKCNLKQQELITYQSQESRCTQQHYQEDL